MAVLISGHQLKKSYGARPLFDGITFALQTGERVGLIGPNGAGKSTLLKIIASRTSPDEGTVSFQKGLRVGYLEQVPAFEPNAMVEATILSGTRSTAAGAQFGEQADIDHDWEAIAATGEIMAKLSLVDGPVESLSGGWKKRVALARELVRKPDLLLLDEPTNHLDVESILWLEDFLSNPSGQHRFATLVVTHDRLFLQRVTTRILELDRRNAGGLLSVDGDYATYLEVKDQLMQAQERREIILKNTFRRETEWLRRGAKARTTKQQARIKRAGELEEEVAELGFRNQARTARIDFQGAERNPKRLIEATGLSKTFGGKKIVNEFNLVITPGTRVGLLGPNGCGKTTLIRLLLGHESPDAGEVFRADGLSVTYFEQNRDILDPDVTVADTLCPRGDHVEYRGGRIHIRGYLDRFLFSAEQANMRVGNLSGGEQSRLLLAKLMLSPANVLVLDEPTNDLDMATLGVLEECVTEFPGAVLFVTHDRYFLDQVATKILGPSEGGKWVAFSDIGQWEAWVKAAVAGGREVGEVRAAVDATGARGATRTARATVQQETRAGSADAANLEQSGSAPATGLALAPPLAKKRRLGFKEQRELDAMEANIEKAETKLAALAAESALPEVVCHAARLTEITKAMSATQAEIERLYARWAELTA